MELIKHKQKLTGARWAEKTLSYIALGLLVYMPFSLFLSRWLSLYTGGLGQWDVLKDIVTLLGLGLAVYIAVRQGLLKEKLFRTIFWLSAAYGLLHLVFFILNPDLHPRSFILATLYNGRILAYLFIGMTAAKYIKKHFGLDRVVRIVLIVSTITALLALVQYVLPKDLMSNFGYSIERGAKPSFFIDDKPDLPRVFSTIRDPNSYGAFLIIPLVLIWLALLSKRQLFSKRLLTGLFGLHSLALFLTFSRGAWLGAAMALLLATYYQHRAATKTTIKKYLPVLAIVVTLIAGGLFFWRSSYLVENVLLHSDEQTVLADPNELRLQVWADSIKKTIDRPLGHGPGTAGLVSIVNPQGTFLNENYYLQIAYEIGIIGLGLFAVVSFFVYKQLRHLSYSIFHLPLLASFWAYGFIALLIHLWSNEAVAVQWWLIAGLAINNDKIKP